MKKNMDSHLLQKMRQAIEEDLRSSLIPLQDDNNLEMVNMIAYHLGWEKGVSQGSGKRIRPLLTLLVCGAMEGEWGKALPAASAIELIHNFSLVHDDIEDNSETRRGKPTVWKRWGISKGINLGDAIFVLSRLASFRLINSTIPAQDVLDVLQTLDKACLELTVGQQLDLYFEELDVVDLDTYLRMIRGKTSALISAATMCGGIIAGVQNPILNILHDYGHHLGLAFQIQDDILGIWGKTAITGKPINDDLRSRKKTLPILYGLNESQEFTDHWKAEQTDDKIIDTMREALELSNALEFSKKRAEEHTQLALSSLQSLKGKAPYQEELHTLTHNLLNREW
jgi:geranylgeranyl diphosphate synthase type I